MNYNSELSYYYYLAVTRAQVQISSTFGLTQIMQTGVNSGPPEKSFYPWAQRGNICNPLCIMS
ncbi:MAG: hypothetical protein K9M56_03465 [Victivallales bacterium]|nr:hypothetical protein [Victivallales bacterium]